MSNSLQSEILNSLVVKMPTIISVCEFWWFVEICNFYNVCSVNFAGVLWTVGWTWGKVHSVWSLSSVISALLRLVMLGLLHS